MLSIIIPAHNEEERIAKTLESYINLFKEKKGREIDDFEIIVVANACEDDTVKVVKEIGKNIEEIRLLNFEQRGKGFAIKEGFKEALKGNSELIGFVDADNATPPLYFYELVKNIKDYDGVIASRYLKNSVVKPKPTFSRRVASKVFNFIVRSLFLFNFRDTQLGGKLFKRRVIERVLPKLSLTQWAFDVDLLYNVKKQGFKIREWPTYWSSIEGSKINLKKSSIQMFFAVLKLRIVNSPFKNTWKIFRPLSAAVYNLVK